MQKTTCALVSVSVLFLLAVGCSTQPATSPVKPGSPLSPPDTSWKKEAWSGSDQPYAAIRKEINKAGKGTGDLVLRYKSAAQKNPKDPVAAYRWGYAYYVAATHNPSLLRSKTMQEVLEFLRAVPSPRSYEFARLRFLLEGNGDEPGAYLKEVGKRLLARRSKDNQVKFTLVRLLNPGLYLEDRKLALAYGQDLMAAMPDKPNVYNLMGDIYMRIYVQTKDPSARDKAIAAYEKYLALAPPNFPRKAAERWIKVLRKRATR